MTTFDISLLALIEHSFVSLEEDVTANVIPCPVPVQLGAVRVKKIGIIEISRLIRCRPGSAIVSQQDVCSTFKAGLCHGSSDSPRNGLIPFRRADVMDTVA